MRIAPSVDPNMIHDKKKPAWSITLTLTVLAILVSSCGPGFEGGLGADARVIPGVRIGAVDSTTSERSLIERFGEHRVVRREIHIGEGFCAPGSVVDPGVRDSVIVVWADTTYAQPAEATVSGRGSRWRTPAGARVGMLLSELEELNSGQPIRFMGFGWDYGGTGSWSEGGRALAIVLRPDSASYAYARRDPRAREIMGDHEVNSRHPLLRRMRVRVEQMSVRWAEPSVQFPCAGP